MELVKRVINDPTLKIAPCRENVHEQNVKKSLQSGLGGPENELKNTDFAVIHPVAFYLLAFFIVGCSLLVVTVRNIFHAGLFLIGAFLGVAGLYAALHNYFLAAAQLLIYSGAIAVLILFGIMMTQRFWAEPQKTHNSLKFLGIPLAIGLIGIMLKAYFALPSVPLTSGMKNFLRGMGAILMQAYILPFEIISVVLLVALIGAVALAKESEES